jgi:hypothetical protein
MAENLARVCDIASEKKKKKIIECGFVRSVK